MLRPSRAALLSLLTIAAACSSGEGGTGPGPTPTISLALGSSAATVTQGGTSPVTATLTRGGGFTGGVALTVEGAPSGVTGSVGTQVSSGNTVTATVTILVDMATAPGTYNLTVRGTGSGVTPATAPFTLIVAATPAYTLALAPGALTITQGANDAVQVTIGRTNYAGAVTLALDGAPNGVTGVFAPPAPTTNTSTLTVTVGLAVAPGVYTLTVRGTGAASLRADTASMENITDVSTPLVLTVAAAPSYTLSLTQPALSIPQGGSAPTTVNIARTNFAGPVSLGLMGFPAGVTVGFNPAATTTNSSVLTVTVGGSTTPGVYNLSVTGTGSAGDKSTPLTLTVTQAAGTTVVDFTSCSAANKPVWLAVQADNGPWQRILPAGDVYTITGAGTTGGIAYVTGQIGFSTIHAQYGTAAELSGGVIMPCGPNRVYRLVSATLQNIGLNFFGRINYGGGTNTRTTDGLLQMQVPVGAFDFMAWKATSTNPAPNPQIRAIIRRAQTTSDFGTLDLDGPESFPGGSAAFTTSPLFSGELMQYFMGYHTGSACTGGGPLLSSGQLASTSFNAPGIVTNQLPTDFHVLQITTDRQVSPGYVDRGVRESFHLLAPRNLVLPPDPPVPTATLTAAWHRVKAAFTRPAEYDGTVSLSYTDNAPVGRSMDVLLTPGYLATQGGNTFIEAPELTGTSGFNTLWLPQANAGFYWISFTGGNPAPCVEGARYVTGSRTGIATRP